MPIKHFQMSLRTPLTINGWNEAIALCQQAIAFSIYRFPHTSQAFLVVQKNQDVTTLCQLEQLTDTPAGYVTAPFHIDRQNPVVIIRPDAYLTVPLPPPSANAERDYELLSYNTNQDVYFSAFADFMTQLHAGTCRKLVLARDEQITTARDIDPFDIFLRAAHEYTNSFVSLWHTPLSGTWLTAMPEVLLSGSDDQWHTVALAGTMKYNEANAHPSLQAWSQKNRDEQDWVSQYIAHILDAHGIGYEAEGPHPEKAGKLVHLCTDFRFSLPDLHAATRLLEELHPTPAVCGFPKAAALPYILQHEGIQRQYYAGFNGPWHLNGRTAFYVTLRCMNLRDAHHIKLFAGGGIIPASQPQEEWQETVRKMHTMKDMLFAHHSH